MFQALDQLVNSRTPIINRYGFEGYLHEYRDTFFLTTEIDIIPNHMPFHAHYNQYPFISTRKQFITVLEDIEISEDLKVLEEWMDDKTRNLFENIRNVRNVYEMLHDNDLINAILPKNLHLSVIDGNKCHNIPESKYHKRVIRMLHNGEWKNADNKTIKGFHVSRISAAADMFKDEQVYAMIDEDDVFKIVVRGKHDNGLACKSYKSNDMIEILAGNFGLTPERGMERMCDQVKKYMIENNLVMSI